MIQGFSFYSEKLCFHGSIRKFQGASKERGTAIFKRKALVGKKDFRIKIHNTGDVVICQHVNLVDICQRYMLKS